LSITHDSTERNAVEQGGVTAKSLCTAVDDGHAQRPSTFLALALQASSTKKRAIVTLTLRMRPFDRISHGWTATFTHYVWPLAINASDVNIYVAKSAIFVAVFPSRLALVMYFFIA